MVTATDEITIFNVRVGTQRREVLYKTTISGVSWYMVSGATGENFRNEDEKFSVRIPISAVVEGGKTYVAPHEFREMDDEEAMNHWTIQTGDYVLHGGCDFDTVVPMDVGGRLLSEFPDSCTVMNAADNTVRGSRAVQHWRIGGR